MGKQWLTGTLIRGILQTYQDQKVPGIYLGQLDHPMP